MAAQAELIQGLRTKYQGTLTFKGKIEDDKVAEEF